MDIGPAKDEVRKNPVCELCHDSGLDLNDEPCPCGCDLDVDDAGRSQVIHRPQR